MADDVPGRGMIRLKYQKGRTVNLGNFESVRVDIGIELDAPYAEVTDSYVKMKAWVEKRLAQEKANG